jgi:MYXO-CTERM domain-containing protein
VPGRNIAGGAAEGAVRDLTNTDLCGKNRWGEVHQDSQAFSASLWQARAAIAGDPKSATFDAVKARKFDRAVLATVGSFAANVDMTTAAQDLAKEVATFIDADAQTKTEASFTAHGMLPACDRVIEWMPGDKKDFLGLDGTDSPYAPSGAKRVPGFVQWKIDVPVGADSINAHLVLAKMAGSFSGNGGFGGGGTAPKLELIVGPPGMPISWVVNTDGGNEAQSAMFSAATGAVNATLSGLPPGPSYVMIVNSGGGIIAENISFDTSCSTPDGCQPDMAMAPPSASSGCKCSFGGAAPATPLLPLLLLLAAVMVRRFVARRFVAAR